MIHHQCTAVCPVPIPPFFHPGGVTPWRSCGTTACCGGGGVQTTKHEPWVRPPLAHARTRNRGGGGGGGGGTLRQQSPRIQPQRVAGNYDFGYNDSTATVDDGDFAPGLGEIIPADQASLGADYSNITHMMSSYSSSSAPWASSSSATPCSSSSSRPPPPEPSPSGVIRRRADEVGPAVGGGDARHRVMASPGFAAASSAVAAAATSGDGRGGDAGVAPAPATPGSGGDKSYGAGSVRAVGFEIRAADGGGSASKRDGDIIRSRKPHVSFVRVLLFPRNYVCVCVCFCRWLREGYAAPTGCKMLLPADLLWLSCRNEKRSSARVESGF